MVLVLVIMFGFASFLLGGFCSAISFVLFKGKTMSTNTYIFLLVYIVGLAIFGKWLITTNVLPITKLTGIFFITFVPAGILTSFGLSQYNV